LKYNKYPYSSEQLSILHIKERTHDNKLNPNIPDPSCYQQ